MKKIKILFLISILFFISGCDYTYKLDLTNEDVLEETFIKFSNEDLIDDSPYKTFKDMTQKYDSIHDRLAGVQTEEVKGANFSTLKFSLKYTNDNYRNSELMNLCYETINYSNTEDHLTFSTSDQFKCFRYYIELDSVQIRVKTNHKVLSSNADIKDGNTYIWNINRKNANYKPIRLNIDKTKEVKLSKKTSWAVPIIIIVLIIIGGGYFLIKKNSQSNSI